MGKNNAPRGTKRGQRKVRETIKPDNFYRSISGQDASILEPGTTSRGEGAIVVSKRNRTRVVMVAGDAKHRNADSPDDFQGPGQPVGSVDQIPGKTDEFRLLFLDGCDDVFGERDISAVMNVGYVNELAWQGCARNGEPGYLQPPWFQFHGVGESDSWRSGQPQGQKSAPRHDIPLHAQLP
jgi:hypothetical protein